jgi:ubiquinone/menaquinone biosynthesis C-methylase UbiE
VIHVILSYAMSDTPSDTRENTAGTTLQAERQYALGYSESEFKRLEQQSELYRDLTEDVLCRAGLAPGMRVLDIGCGVGDVSLLAAELVGPSGFVVGVDRSSEAVETARRGAAASGTTRTSFAAAELDAFSSEARFDALIGRFILMYLPDPAAALRKLRSHLVPGAIVAFQEMEMSLTRSVPPLPLFQQGVEWVIETFKRAGFEANMGPKLYTTFQQAGLPAPRMIAASRVEGGPDSQVYDYLTATLRSLLPMAEKLGMTTSAEVGIDTLTERLRRQAIQHNACLMPPTLIAHGAACPSDDCPLVFRP